MSRDELPPWCRRTLARLLPGDWCPDITRDLEEDYLRRRAISPSRARLWVWGQTFLFVGRFAAAEIGERLRACRPSPADLGGSLRSLARTPWVSVLSVLSLATGIAMAVVAVAVIDGTFYGELPYPDGDRFVLVQDFDRTGGWPVDVRADEYWRRRGLESFAGLAAYTRRNVLLEADSGEPRAVSAVWVTPELLPMLGVAPRLGRLLSPGDVATGAVPVTVISDSLWRTRLGASADAVGSDLRIAGQPHRIVGVMPPEFAFPWASDALWLPLQTDPGAANVSRERLLMLGKLAPAASVARAEAELSAVARPDPTQVPDDHAVSHRVIPFARGAGGVAQELVLAAIVGGLVLLLLLMAANVANLVLARNATRLPEMAVRSALGASRARIVTQLLLEVGAMVALAAALGVALAAAALAQLAVRIPQLPFWADLSIRVEIVLFALALAAVVAVVAGLVPALRATHADVASTLKESSRAVAGMRFGRLAGTLIVVELAVAMGFLGVAAVLGQSLLGFGYAGAGLDSAHVLVAQLYFGWPEELQDPDTDLTSAEREVIRRAFMQESDRQRRAIEAALLELPSVRTAASGSRFPGNESEARLVEIDDPAGDRLVSAEIAEIGRGYVELLGNRVLRGRDFLATEHEAGLPVAMVNERFVEAHLEGANPLGRRLRLVPRRADVDPDSAPWREIVGVLPDLGLNPGDPDNADGVYLPFPPLNILRLAVRTDEEPARLVPALQRVVRDVNPEIRVQWTKSLEQQMREPVALFRGLGAGFVVLGALALVLATASLHALTSLAVTSRLRELGIRRALGADAAALARAVVRRGVAQLAAGALLGTGIALGLMRLIDNVPFEVRSGNPIVVAAVGAVLLAAGVAATAAPVRRAIGADPAEVLRGD